MEGLLRDYRETVLRPCDIGAGVSEAQGLSH